ncbi:hypothetical protein [Parapedomonas caeni]
MNNYTSWRNVNRAICPEPGPRHTFVVLLINGKRVSFKSVDEYEKQRAAAEQLAHEHPWQVKLLPMTGRELLGFYGIEPDEPKSMADLDPEFRAQAVKNFMDVLRTSIEESEREEALDLLQKLGALHV